VKWFKHDSDASIDAKLQILLLDYGAAGYGLYWYCVELIAQGVNESNITFELEHDARIIARNLNLSVAETTDMMKKMVELGLFSFSNNNKLACYALAKRIDKSMTSSPIMREIIGNIRNENHDSVMIQSVNSHDSIMIDSDKVMQDKNREDKNREDTDKKQKKASNAKPSASLVCPSDVDSSIFAEWLAVRKAKRQIAPTERVIANIRSEAQKVGMTLQQAITACCDNGWAGFKASWIENQSTGNTPAKTAATNNGMQVLDREGWTAKAGEGWYTPWGTREGWHNGVFYENDCEMMGVIA
jgi:hypothetical protein